jgi:hypothetical protein
MSLVCRKIDSTPAASIGPEISLPVPRSTISRCIGVVLHRIGYNENLCPRFSHPLRLYIVGAGVSLLPD